MEDIDFNIPSLHNVWCTFRNGKRPSRAIDEFAYNIEANLARLSTEITNRSYQHGGYQTVVVHEKKRRDLAVADVRDRVVHRLLYDYLVPQFDRSFDPDVWSCRKDKGLHKCLARTQKLLRKNQQGYVWRADITKFFDNVNHQVLLDCLKRKISQDEPALWLCQEVIASYNVSDRHRQTQTDTDRHRQTDTDRQTATPNYAKHGIPIGNLTSQIFANIYMHEFDRFIRTQLKPKAYVRYGDDFVLFCPNRQAAYQLRAEASRYLQTSLHLTVNPKNDIVVPANKGLHFLGRAVTANFISVDRYTTRQTLNKVNTRNISSYRALPLVKSVKHQLDWILLENGFDKYN